MSMYVIIKLYFLQKTFKTHKEKLVLLYSLGKCVIGSPLITSFKSRVSIGLKLFLAQIPIVCIFQMV